MLKNLLTLSTVFFMATSFAADKKADAKKAKADKAAAAETLAIDTAASTIEWTGHKKMGDKHVGKIKLKDGKVEMKDGKLTGGNFTVDMATLSNDDLKEKPDYQKKLEGHLKSDDFFKVDKHPTSEFKITSVTEKDGKTMVAGDLTILGKTEKIEFPAKIEKKDGVVTGTAALELDRTKWGIVYGSGNVFKELTADKIITNNFDLKLNLVTKK